jgi:hypothetical protein
MFLFAMDANLLENGAHDEILISLLRVPPFRGKGHDKMDRERRLDKHRLKARGVSTALLLDCKVLRDFPTIFLLDSREIPLRWWHNSTLIHNYRVVLQRFIAVLEGWSAIEGWKDDLLTLLHAREGDGTLENLTEAQIKSAVDGIRTLLENPVGEDTICCRLGVAVRKALLKAEPLRVNFAEHVKEVNAAERREIRAKCKAGDKLMYHSGDEGNVDENAAPCFVVENEGDEKGLVYVSAKMTGAGKWDAPLGKLERMPVDDHVPAVIEAANPASLRKTEWE